MFEIFVKKKFLVDYLKGFIDIHNHILPGIDDGAKTVEDSIALIKGFSEFGVTNFIATPHIMHEYYPNGPNTIYKALGEVKNELLKIKLKNISIDAAAEHMIDSNFENILETGSIMPIKKKYLLIEMSYLQPSINFDDAIIKIARNKYFPILAHPERYLYLHNRFNIYKKYKDEKGIFFQLNILSLCEYYGKSVQKMAIKLINEEMIDFIATDIHNERQLSYLKELKISDKQLKKIIPIIENTMNSFY